MARQLTDISPELRDRAIRVIRDYGAVSIPVAINLIANLRCRPALLEAWVERIEQNASELAALTENERRRLHDLEIENRELRHANDLLRQAAICCAEAAFSRRRRGE